MHSRRRSTGGPSSIPPSTVKSISAAIVLAFAVTFGVAAAPASAAGIPCWKALINDWFDGRIDKKYEPECYTQAIKHLPIDVKQYSGAEDDIRRAYTRLIRRFKPQPA